MRFNELSLTATAQFLGDGEFDSRELQQALDACQWTYVCRTAKNTPIQVDSEWVVLASIEVYRGRKKMGRAVRFTQSGDGPVQVICLPSDAVGQLRIASAGSLACLSQVHRFELLDCRHNMLDHLLKDGLA